jgi:phage recombination protein Bet
MTQSEGTALTVAREQLAPLGYSDSQIDLLRETIAKGTTPDQFALFAAYVRRTGLDPFARQIFAIVRRGQNGPTMTIQTGIDGYRALAEETGKYGGRSRPIYGPACNCQLARDFPHPSSAAVSVKKLLNGVVVETEAEVDFDEYVELTRDGKPSNLWARMPKLMISKCAEAQALRAAFPKQLSGLYTAEEMGQANQPIIETVPAHALPEPTVSVTDPDDSEAREEYTQVVYAGWSTDKVLAEKQRDALRHNHHTDDLTEIPFDTLERLATGWRNKLASQQEVRA